MSHNIDTAADEGEGGRESLFITKIHLNAPRTWILKHYMFISIGNVETATLRCL